MSHNLKPEKPQLKVVDLSEASASPDVIMHCEELLKMAKSGQIEGIATVYAKKGYQVRTAYHFGRVDYDINTGLDLIKADLINQVES